MGIEEQITNLQLLNQFWILLFFIIPIVLISRTVVAGTRYSPILIIVIFGLSMGYILEMTDVASPGLVEFPFVDLMASTTIIALTVSFFVGGQELRKILGNKKEEVDDMLVPSEEETVLGTTRTQFMFIIRSFFILLGIEGMTRLILGTGQDDMLSAYYPLIAYIGLVGSVIFIDNKARILDKRLYIRKGIFEILAIIAVLYLSYHTAQWFQSAIALPQIFFSMVIAASAGAFLYRWKSGPVIRALLFGGIPLVLAGNFLIGGSRMGEVFAVEGVNTILAYGFFGQLLWMFGGIALLIFFAGTTHARNLAPGMAGSLSHSGLTGACTAGDFGRIAAKRAPIMINIPFFGHIFVFSILAISAEQESLWLLPSFILVSAGILLTVFALRNLKNSNAEDKKEVNALMLFSFGWQICAVFGGLTLLNLTAMQIDYTAMAQTSAISHFGLFAAIQEGMFGADAASLIPFIFSMPFLVHPVVFFMFGKAMENNGEMPVKPVYILTAVGILGVLTALLFL